MNRIRVLLADDHRLVAEGLMRVLEQDFELLGIVEDGHALLAAARELKPDVIVTDISMPGLSGVEVLEELKNENPEVRVVILTMHHNVAYARQAMNLGAMGFVLKHSAAEELILAVRAAANGRTFVSPAIAGELFQALRDGRGGEEDMVSKLTLRQREILKLLVNGHSAKVIAARLGISRRTVEFHKYSMMEGLGVKTTAALIRFALQSGISEL
ncbi:MAG TPA: response regulator transcription factor [Xanthomonadales bacterium]|nr:response regulator transcription factor [Xanthomonadales bacterium]